MNANNSTAALPQQDYPLALTPEALGNVIRLAAPEGPVTVKGVAKEVKVWTRPGDTEPTKTYGRLVLGDANIRFELPATSRLRDDAHVVLYGTLRVRAAQAYRMTHEVTLVGDVVGRWQPVVEDADAPTIPLERKVARMSLEVVVAKHGIEAVGFLATKTAWQDLTQAAASVSELALCTRGEPNFMKATVFVESLKTMLASTPRIKALVVARGGGEGMEIIGDEPVVAAALLECGLPFFTAMGHERDILLLDKHADYSYPTPSIFGHSLAEAARTHAEKVAQAQRLNDLQTKYDASVKALADARVNAPEQTVRITHQSTASPRRFNYVLPGIVLLVLLMVFLLGRCSHG
ncbi:exodeoxyribonuclease VII large subunit [Burkholderia sp. F1]|uniref:exodeoxyribonuclease VII large subunit n=1 Tax=Burkholderia sp. F1 TaxID=3366817 RepID=UPI003D726F43